MPKIDRIAIYIPSGQEVDRAARLAMENIDKQLKKMPPLKKPASAADNFPGIYDDANSFKPLEIKNTLGLNKLMTDKAIRTYRSAG